MPNTTTKCKCGAGYLYMKGHNLRETSRFCKPCEIKDEKFGEKVFWAILITPVVLIVTGISLFFALKAPSDSYGYGSMNCDVLQNISYELRRTNNLIDRTFWGQAEHDNKVENVDDWIEEKDC